MSGKIRRRMMRARRRNKSATSRDPVLQVEPLERRLLLDVAGLWDEIGWRSASGSGVSWDSDNGITSS